MSLILAILMSTIIYLIFKIFQDFSWNTILVLISIVLIFLTISSLFTIEASESLIIYFDDDKYKRIALKKHGHKWLGLWSKYDEVINGLKTINDPPKEFLNMNILPVWKGKNYQFMFFWIYAGFDFLTLPASLFYNKIIIPYFNPKIIEAIKRFIQGNDFRSVPYIKNVSVVPFPNCDDRIDISIPEHIDLELSQEANKNAEIIIPTLREALALNALGTKINISTVNLPWNTLIHTSYFDNTEIIDLLALHIKISILEDSEINLDKTISQVHLEWLRKFKESVRNEMLESYSSTPPYNSTN